MAALHFWLVCAHTHICESAPISSFPTAKCLFMWLWQTPSWSWFKMWPPAPSCRLVHAVILFLLHSNSYNCTHIPVISTTAEIRYVCFSVGVLFQCRLNVEGEGQVHVGCKVVQSWADSLTVLSVHIEGAHYVKEQCDPCKEPALLSCLVSGAFPLSDTPLIHHFSLFTSFLHLLMWTISAGALFTQSQQELIINVEPLLSSCL